MAWVVVNKDGTECIFESRPLRLKREWIVINSFENWMPLPKGSIKKLIGRDLTWEDNPIELKEE